MTSPKSEVYTLYTAMSPSAGPVLNYGASLKITIFFIQGGFTRLVELCKSIWISHENKLLYSWCDISKSPDQYFIVSMSFINSYNYRVQYNIYLSVEHNFKNILYFCAICLCKWTEFIV